LAIPAGRKGANFNIGLFIPYTTGPRLMKVVAIEITKWNTLDMQDDSIQSAVFPHRSRNDLSGDLRCPVHAWIELINKELE